MEDINIVNLINNAISGTNTASVDWGNSSITLFGGNDNFRNTSIHVGNGSANNTNLNISNNTAFIANECSSEMDGYQVGALVINNGFCSLQQTKPGYGTTSLMFEDPQTYTTVKVPGLPYGTYTLSVAKVFSDSTTSAKSSSTLTSEHPEFLPGDKVHCMDITTGALIYEKTESGWAHYAVTETL